MGSTLAKDTKIEQPDYTSLSDAIIPESPLDALIKDYMLDIYSCLETYEKKLIPYDPFDSTRLAARNLIISIRDLSNLSSWSSFISLMLVFIVENKNNIEVLFDMMASYRSIIRYDAIIISSKNN